METWIPSQKNRAEGIFAHNGQFLRPTSVICLLLKVAFQRTKQDSKKRTGCSDLNQGPDMSDSRANSHNTNPGFKVRRKEMAVRKALWL